MELRRIQITNFKGIKSLDLEFNGSSRICGANGSGKTSIYDAFMWCLFGIDSSERKSFEIKPLDKHGKEIVKQDIEVSVYLVDGAITKYTKSQREKWTRKRGNEDEEYTGNETSCSINDVPMTATQYAGQIAELIPAERFKLVTNVYAFPDLHWTERRKILMEVAGHVSNDELLAVEPKLSEIIELDLVNYAKEIQAKKKKIQAEVDQIPARIDEVKRSMPDFDPKELERLKNTQADSGAEIRKQKLALEEKIEALMAKGRAELAQMRIDEAYAASEYESKVKTLRDEQMRLEGLISRLRPQSEYLTDSLNKLRAEYKAIQAEQFDGKCPTCGGPMGDASDFNRKKAARLEELNVRGKTLRGQQEDAFAQIEKATNALGQIVFPERTTTKVSDETFWAAYKAMPEIRVLRQQIESLPAESTFDNERLKALEAMPGIIAQAEARIVELQNRLREGNAEIAKIQRHEMLIAKFWKLKVQMVDERLADVFPTLRFKLFKPLLNGGEEPACDVLINGVPFSDANHAAKINSGLEIISALSKHWGVKAPVFIDNAEAVLELAKFDGQIIALNVAKTKKLTVESL